MNQSIWIKKIKKLSKHSSKPILATNYFHKGSNFQLGKWLPLSQAGRPIDHRTVLSNEVVIDIDAKKWGTCKEFAEVIKRYLDENNIPYMLADTGGKGLHYHIWFEAEVSDEFKPTVLRAKKKGFNMRQLRIRLWKHILLNAGFKLSHMGKGSILDDALVNWNDESKGHMVRCVGGKKKRAVSELGNVKWAWKTKLEEVPNRKDRAKSLREVDFPDEPELWLVPEGILKKIVTQYLSQTSEPGEEVQIKKYEGLYTRLPCVQKLIKRGNKEGSRHDGAGAISLACAMDDLNNNKTLKILKQYKQSCDSLGGVTSFSISELKHWVNWYKKRENETYWDDRTCSIMKRFGITEEIKCPNCPLKKQFNKRALEFLTKGNIIENVQEQMGKVIVNEKENRMLLFLCYLSSYLDHRIHPKMSGKSSIGKSFLLNQVLKFIPDEDVLERLTSASAKYFNYALTQNPDIPKVEREGEMVPNIDGKILIVQEFEGAEDAIVTLRPLMSGDQDGLNVGIVDKGENDANVHKNMAAVGRPVFASASTDYQLDKEFMTRVWEMELDDSKEQTKAIMEFEAEEDVNPGCHEAPMREVIVDGIKLLKQSVINVMNPFSMLLAKRMPVSEEFVRLRRDFKKIKEFIKISAWLNQFQRPKININEKDYVLASLEDYRTIKRLIQPSFTMIFSGSKKVKEVYKLCEKMEGYGEEITSSSMARKLGCGTGKARRLLNLLDAKGFVLKKKAEHRRGYVYEVRDKKDVEFPELTEEDLREHYEKLKEGEEEGEGVVGGVKTSDILKKILD